MACRRSRSCRRPYVAAPTARTAKSHGCATAIANTRTVRVTAAAGCRSGQLSREHRASWPHRGQACAVTARPRGPRLRVSVDRRRSLPPSARKHGLRRQRRTGAPSRRSASTSVGNRFPANAAQRPHPPKGCSTPKAPYRSPLPSLFSHHLARMVQDRNELRQRFENLRANDFAVGWGTQWASGAWRAAPGHGILAKNFGIWHVFGTPSSR